MLFFALQIKQAINNAEIALADRRTEEERSDQNQKGYVDGAVRAPRIDSRPAACVRAFCLLFP